MKTLSNKELSQLEDQAKIDDFFKSLLSHYKLKGFLTKTQYYWLNLFIGQSESNDSDTLKTHLKHTIVKMPCPHCNFLCSPQIEFCSKCGEPLPQIEKIFSIKGTSDSGVIEENYLEKNIIHSIEKLINREIPEKKSFEVSSRCYVKEDDQIIAINLYNCGLTMFPQELLRLPTLKILTLRRNSISKLLNQIGLLSKLEHFDLRINKLQKLPNSIGLLSNLETLNLSSNQLIELPDSIGNLKSLKALNLKHNKLKKIPTSILRLNHLEKLNLKANYWISNQDIVDAIKQRGIEVIQ